MRRIYPKNVRRIRATIGGKTYCYRSEGEFMWAQYLDWLKQSGEIVEWLYEPSPFYFESIKFGPAQYKLDFLVYPKEDEHIYYQEFKRGYLDGPAVTKLRRMAEQYPDVIIELVIEKPRKKDAHRLYIVKKYVRRIVNADIIFKQLGKLIKSAKDWQMAEELSAKEC
jgi:hypothetical protein